MKDARRSGFGVVLPEWLGVESDMRQCQACVRNKQKRQHVQKARVSVVLVNSHPDAHVFQGACLHPVIWEAMEDIKRFCKRNKAVKLSSEGSPCYL